jgi:hypothetical protein
MMKSVRLHDTDVAASNVCPHEKQIIRIVSELVASFIDGHNAIFVIPYIPCAILDGDKISRASKVRVHFGIRKMAFDHPPFGPVNDALAIIHVNLNRVDHIAGYFNAAHVAAKELPRIVALLQATGGYLMGSGAKVGIKAVVLCNVSRQ